MSVHKGRGVLSAELHNEGHLAGGALGLRGVSRHNTCATEALGVLDRTGQAPGQRPCAQPGRAWEDMPPQ